MAKILLIEDEPDQSQMIKCRLESRGYKVVTAFKAEEGCTLAVQENPDLIILDMILPGMHGLEAAINLKKNPETKDIPIIALTAMSMPDFQMVCYREGISSFIRKPYEPEDLFQAIEKNLMTSPKEAEKERELERTLEEEIEAELPEEVPMKKGKFSFRKKKILIVEDNQDFLKTLGIRLTSCGYQVVAASDAAHAVKMAQSEKPDLIILDLVIPGGSRGQVFENLKNYFRTMATPVILMSGVLSPQLLREKADEFGANDFILKPFESEKLLEKIKKTLEK